MSKKPGQDVYPHEESTGVFDVPLPPSRPPVAQSGLIAGRYQVVERIGAGGMGQVVHARHTRLGKSFALKLMRAEHSLDPDALALFRSEAQLASTLSHPNIVSVVDFGEDPDWGLFIAMEYLEGEPLSARIAAQAPLPIDLSCQLAIQLASALEHSHANLVVHSDLKAENVLCVEGGNGPWKVKLLDFGTAQLSRHEAGKDDQIAGTPAYMAPERIQGNAPAPSNDIYALGVLLYEMLTGQVPFEGEDLLSILRQHLEVEPEPAGARRGEVLDDALDRILNRALAKDPASRYARAAELARDLSDYLSTKGAQQRASEQRAGIAEYSREEAAADAFDALGIAAAGLDAEGRVRVANPAFAKLVRAASPDAIEGTSVIDTALLRMHPGIREDIRLVAMKGKLIRRRLSVQLKGGQGADVRLSINPTHGRAGSCILVVHGLGRSGS